MHGCEGQGSHHQSPSGKPAHTSGIGLSFPPSDPNGSLEGAQVPPGLLGLVMIAGESLGGYGPSTPDAPLTWYEPHVEGNLALAVVDGLPGPVGLGQPLAQVTYGVSEQELAKGTDRASV